MEEAFLRFPHIPEQILESLDNTSLTNSRVVNISWQNFIDQKKYPESRFMDVIAHLKETCNYGDTVFHLACREGYARIAEMIMEKSGEVNIDLNAKNIFGMTAFHSACENDMPDDRYPDLAFIETPKYLVTLSKCQLSCLRSVYLS